MEQVVIGIGSNMGDRLDYMSRARYFLSDTLIDPIFSSIYETAPVGIADQPFFNAVATGLTSETPSSLLNLLKSFEKSQGRDQRSPRWSNRILDLDIIAFGNQCINQESVIIPHPHYRTRKFVLVPLLEILPNFVDPLSKSPIKELIEQAPPLSVKKKNLKW